MKRDRLTTITVKRLAGLRENYLQQLRDAQNRVNPETWTYRYLAGEIEVLEEAHDYLGELHAEAKA